MSKVFLLDTNTFFYFLSSIPDSTSQHIPKFDSTAMRMIQEGTSYISSITKIEIMSTIGKCARGSGGNIEKCNRVISEHGDTCPHHWHTNKKKRWSNEKIKRWIKLVDDSICGRSSILNVSVLPFSEVELLDAERIIQHALIHNFGSLDAVIAATAKNYCGSSADGITVLTSDKGLKACLGKCSIPVLDLLNQRVADDLCTNTIE